MEVVLFADDAGREPVTDYLRALGRSGEGSVIGTYARRVALLEAEGLLLGMPYARLINRVARLYELRFGDHRAAYAEHGGVIMLLHAWRKQTQRLDRREEAVALRRLDEWRRRT